MPPFQKSLGLSIGVRGKKLRELRVLLSKSSLRGRVEELVATDDPMPLQHHVVGVLLNQVSAKKGVAKHGGRAREASLTEFRQLCGMGNSPPRARKILRSKRGRVV